MFKLRPGEKLVPVDDVIAFVDLMHRWTFQTALKFAYEFYHGNLVVSWVNGCVHNEAKNYVLLSGVKMWCEQNQAYACANLDRLVYLREDVERIEAQNPHYAADVHDDMYDEFTLGRCTKENAAQLAPEILHILQNLYWDYCVAKKQPFPGQHEIKMWLQGEEMFHPDLAMPGPKNKWRAKPEKMIPIFRKGTLGIHFPTKKVIDYSVLEKFVADRKKQGITGGVELGFELLQLEPELNNASLVRLIDPTISFTTKKQKAAARQRGARLRAKILKRYCSKNSHA